MIRDYTVPLVRKSATFDSHWQTAFRKVLEEARPGRTDALVKILE